MNNTYKILTGTLEGKSPFLRPRCRWEENIKTVKEIGWMGVDWIHLVHIGDRVL
jgi:hypothetical protein